MANPELVVALSPRVTACRQLRKRMMSADTSRPDHAGFDSKSIFEGALVEE
jgi:hypothetical protein